MPDLLELETTQTLEPEKVETPPEEQVLEGAEETKPKEGEETTGEGETVTSLFGEDGKKLDPAVRDALAKIKEGKVEGVKPEVGKLLTKAAYRVAELDREFPGGLTEVRELRDKVEEFGGLTGIQEKLDGLTELDGLAQQFMAGDPAFVEDMATSSPESFAALAPAFLDRYAQIHPEGFGAYVGRVVYGDMQRNDVPLLMARLADVLGDNPKAVEIFNALNAYLGGYKTLAAKSVEPPRPKTAAAQPQQADQQRKEEELRLREWKIERDQAQRSMVDAEYTKALAGRKPDTEERAQIKELFIVRSKAAADKLFPGWFEKSQRFIKSGDKAGYLRYLGSIYRRVIPDAMASSVASTMKAARKPAAAAQTPGTKPAAAAKPTGGGEAGGAFKPVAAEPSTWDIDYNRTSTAMLKENKAFLKSGARVSWK